MKTRQLKDWLDAYMTYTNNSEPPDTYRLWTGISVIAACLKRKCVLRWGTLPIYPNMYIVLVGPSGRCRKGTAMSQGMFFLREMGIKLAAESITREALIRELKESNDTQVDPQTNDMHLHASLTIYSQELTVFLGYNNQALMSDLTDWFDCRDTWTYRTKHMGTDEIVGVWVNLIGATTPELIQTTLPRDAIGGGLTSRMIFVFEPKKGKTVVAPFLSESERELEVKLLEDLQKICMISGEFKISDEFMDRWIAWYTEASEGKPPFEDYKFSGYFERRPTHLLKLCLILCASRTSDKRITEGDFDRAVEIMDRTEVRMPYAFSGFGKNQSADVMERVCATLRKRSVMTFGELLHVFYKDADKWALEKIIDSLVSMQAARVEWAGKERIIHYVDDNVFDEGE